MKQRYFEEMNEWTIKKMGMATLHHTSESIAYNGKIIENGYQRGLNESPNMNKLVNVFAKKGGTTLMTADTNAGKTYAIINTFKDKFFNPIQGKVQYINILVVPTRPQADQIKNEYNIESIVAKTKISKTHDFASFNTFCILPDTANAMLSILEKMDSGVHINLCIDEAHNLFLESRGYRGKALDQLDQLSQYVKSRNGSVVLMTATPDALMCHKFDAYLHFVNQAPSPVARELSVVQSAAKTNAHYLNDLVDFITMQVIRGYIPFVRLNNIKGIEMVTQELLKRDILAVHLDSSQKGMKENFCVLSESYVKEYVNKVYGDIIGGSKLPEEINNKKIQVYLVTSFIELGTNICKVGDYENSKLFPIFACNDVKNTNTSSIVQFLNRVRFQVEKCAVFISKRVAEDVPYYANHASKHKLPIPKFLNLGDFYLREFKSVTHAAKEINVGTESLMKGLVRNKKLNEYINYSLACVSLDGSQNDEGCLTYNAKLKRIDIDFVSFCERTFPKYMGQFYYHQDQLVQVLANELNIPCHIIDLSGADGNADTKALEDKEVSLNDIKDSIVQAMENPLLKEVLEGDICKLDIERAPIEAKISSTGDTALDELIAQDRELNRITDAVNNDETISDPLAHLNFEQREYYHKMSSLLLSNNGKAIATMLKASKTQEDIESVCTSVLSCNSAKQVKSLHKEFVRDYCTCQLSKKAIRGLEGFLAKEISYKELIFHLGEHEAKKVLELSNSGYSNLLKNAISCDMDTTTVLNAIAEGKSAYAIKKMIIKYQRSVYNKYYVNGDKDLLLGLSGVEQRVALDELFKINESGNVTQLQLTGHLLQRLAGLLTKARQRYSFKVYTIKDALSLCKDVFTLRTKGNDFVITGLI